MDSTIIAALIGLMGIAISPFLTLFIQERLSTKSLPQAPANRISALCGFWSGSCEQDKNRPEDPILKIEVDAQLIQKKKFICGTANGKLSDNSPFNLNLSNGIYDGKYLNILFSNINPNTLHRGMITVELNNEGNKLFGKYLANGLKTGEIVSGKIILNKKINV